MLFSGELSITSAGWLLVVGADVLLPLPLGVPEVAEVVEEEQAARPAAASAAAVTASARLLGRGHFVNIDFPLGCFIFCCGVAEVVRVS
jgi:hypothetical protein